MNDKPAFRHARTFGRAAALALCCLLAADQDAEARRAHRTKAKRPPPPRRDFRIHRQAKSARTDPLSRHALRAGEPGARSTAGPPTIMRPPIATFLASCRALVGSAKGSRDTRPVYPALVEICRKARAAGTLGGEAARKFFEENFRPVRVAKSRRSERISHRLLRAGRRRLAHADRRLQGAAVWAAARSRPHGAQAQGGELSEHRPRRAPDRARQIRAVFRPRANRGWRARDQEARNRLPQGRERSAVHPDPGIGAHPPHRRHAAARQLRLAQRAPLHAGRPHPDRAQHHLARRHVDGPHPQMDGGESRRRKRAAAAEQVLCVLPQHRPARERGGEGRAGRAAHGVALDRGGPRAARLRHAVLHRRRAADRERGLDHQIPQADDRAGHGLGDRRPGARRHLFRLGRGGGPDRRPHQESGALRDADAARARSGGGGHARCRCPSRAPRLRRNPPSRPPPMRRCRSAPPLADPIPLPRPRPKS